MYEYRAANGTKIWNNSILIKKQTGYLSIPSCSKFKVKTVLHMSEIEHCKSYIYVSRIYKQNDHNLHSVSQSFRQSTHVYSKLLLKSRLQDLSLNTRKVLRCTVTSRPLSSISVAVELKWLKFDFVHTRKAVNWFWCRSQHNL